MYTIIPQFIYLNYKDVYFSPGGYTILEVGLFIVSNFFNMGGFLWNVLYTFLNTFIWLYTKNGCVQKIFICYQIGQQIIQIQEN